MFEKDRRRRAKFSISLAMLISASGFLFGTPDNSSLRHYLGVVSAYADHDRGNGKSQHGNTKHGSQPQKSTGQSTIGASLTKTGIQSGPIVEQSVQSGLSGANSYADRSSKSRNKHSKNRRTTKASDSRKAGNSRPRNNSNRPLQLMSTLERGEDDGSETGYDKPLEPIAAAQQGGILSGPPLALLPPIFGGGQNGPVRQANEANGPPGVPGARPTLSPIDLTGHPLALFLAGGYEPNDILVAVSEGQSSTFGSLAVEYGLNLEDTLQSALLPFALAKFTLSEGLQVHGLVEALEDNPLVLAATPNFRYTTMAEKIPTSFQFAKHRINLDKAHEIATGKAIKIAVIDTGIDIDHKELEGSVIDRFDAIGSNDDSSITHGTAIAGVIAAKSAITGVAPDVGILSAKTFASSDDDETSFGTTYGIIKSLDWAYRSGARVFNLSFAGPKDPVLISALDRLSAQNAIMIGAAGNFGPGKPPAFPAAHTSVIAVTATDHNDKIYDRANRGSYIAVAAPGVDVLTTTPGDSYEMLSGTSIATAHVSGVVALLLEHDPNIDPKTIARLLKRSSRDLGPRGTDPDFGAGLIDAYKALKARQARTGIISRLD